MPIQVKRLLMAFAVFIALMFVLKYYLTPESWREYGAYRGNALIEIADKEARYVEMETCSMCHDSISAIREQSPHKAIQCEICHGPGNKHCDEPEINHMELAESSSLCLRCHSRNAARPDIIKQIDYEEHSEGEECINCHNPHQPWL